MELKQEITGILNRDGSIQFTQISTKTVKHIFENETLFHPFFLDPERNFDDIQVFDLSNGKERPVKNVLKLDIENCDGEYVFNARLKQILVCHFKTTKSERKIKVQTLVLPQKQLQECRRKNKYDYTIFSDMDFNFFSQNNSIIYPIYLKIQGSEDVILQDPPIEFPLNMNNETLNGSIDFIENGYIINIPSQKFGHLILNLDMRIVGFDKEKFEVQNKYYGLTIYSLIIATLTIISSIIYRRNNEQNLLKIFTFSLDILFGLVLYNVLINLPNDVGKELISLSSAVLPAIISILGFVFSITIILIPSEWIARIRDFFRNHLSRLRRSLVETVNRVF